MDVLVVETVVPVVTLAPVEVPVVDVEVPVESEFLDATADVVVEEVEEVLFVEGASNGLREGVSPAEQRIVVASAVLTVMPMFRPTQPASSGIGQSSKKGKPKK